MGSDSLWFSPWILASMAAVILGLVLFTRGLRARERYVLCRIHCPESGRPVEALLVRDVDSARFRAVERCSAFPKPDRVQCDRCCLDLLNRGVHLADGPMRF